MTPFVSYTTELVNMRRDSSAPTVTTFLALPGERRLSGRPPRPLSPPTPSLPAANTYKMGWSPVTSGSASRTAASYRAEIELYSVAEGYPQLLLEMGALVRPLGPFSARFVRAYVSCRKMSEATGPTSRSMGRMNSRAEGWSIADVVAHMGAGCHAMFGPAVVKILLADDIEQTNDQMVAIRRELLSR